LFSGQCLFSHFLVLILKISFSTKKQPIAKQNGTHAIGDIQHNPTQKEWLKSAGFNESCEF
jgi:hypothetical protein